MRELAFLTKEFKNFSIHDLTQKKPRNIDFKFNGGIIRIC